MDAYVFYVSQPERLRAGGYRFEVASLRLRVHGPFPTHTEAVAARRALEDRWRRRAEALGGRFRTDGPTTWVVEVPAGTPVLGLPLSNAPVPTRKSGDPRDDPPLRIRGGAWKIR